MKCKAFAIITQDKVRKVIISSDKKTSIILSKIFYGNNIDVVDCSGYDVTKGDYYINGVFYNNDRVTPVPKIITDDSHDEYNKGTLSDDIDYLSKKLYDNNELFHATEEKMIYLLGKNNNSNQ